MPHVRANFIMMGKICPNTNIPPLFRRENLGQILCPKLNFFKIILKNKKK
jgi:hypothetical protein